MLNKLVLLVVVFFTGCATQPVPMPPPKSTTCDGVYVPGKGCQSLSSGNYGGTVRGHHEEEN